MKSRPLILITNDDGVYAPGIKHLFNALSSWADAIVVAPATEQSGVGMSITIRHPLRIEPISWPSVDNQVWAVNGTPADCVKLALNVILKQAPDLIVSGINRGSNAGRNVLYSGTIAAIIEGAMHDIPGIAFSAADFVNPNYALVESYIPKIIDYVFEHPLPSGSFLNVNFPKNHFSEIKGIKFASQGKEYWSESVEKREHPAERCPYYWLGAKLAQFEEEPNSDISLLKQGYATVVPIHIHQLTHQHLLENQTQHFENFVNQKPEKSLA